MMRYGIRKSNKHSYDDFNLIMIDRKIETPIKEKIPYMNGYYDFSKLYGSDFYEERKLTYTFRLKGRDIRDINNKYTTVANWLTEGNKEPLFDDLFSGYYFLAECEGNIDFKELNINKKYATIEVEFIAYPFKISEKNEGENLWDDFNFELDILQRTKFEVNGSLDVEIYNASICEVVPTMYTTDAFTITRDGVNYNLKAGKTKNFMFKFAQGSNKMTLKGNGIIEFVFKKEVL